MFLNLAGGGIAGAIVGQPSRAVVMKLARLWLAVVDSVGLSVVANGAEQRVGINVTFCRALSVRRIVSTISQAQIIAKLQPRVSLKNNESRRLSAE